jgi:hypothetical protein
MTVQLRQQQQEEDCASIKVIHHLRLWRSFDDDDVMARCRCGHVEVGDRMCDVVERWAQHMNEVRVKMEHT